MDYHISGEEVKEPGASTSEEVTAWQNRSLEKVYPFIFAVFTPQAARIPSHLLGQAVGKGFSPKFALFSQRLP